jgi:hypothetical protein
MIKKPRDTRRPKPALGCRAKENNNNNNNKHCIILASNCSNKQMRIKDHKSYINIKFLHVSAPMLCLHGIQTTKVGKHTTVLTFG